MRVNYHTHTYRCGHAQGTEEDYVKAAIEGGMEILGFADHCTYLLHPEATQKRCLTLQEFPEYAAAVREAAERHKDQIRVHLGVEAEYFPETFQQLRRICREAKSCDLPLEINLLGIHKQKHYPCREFFELLAEEGNTVIFGADAHQPERFLNHEAEKKGLELVGQYGLNLIETTPFRPI